MDRKVAQSNYEKFAHAMIKELRTLKAGRVQVVFRNHKSGVVDENFFIIPALITDEIKFKFGGYTNFPALSMLSFPLTPGAHEAPPEHLTVGDNGNGAFIVEKEHVTYLMDPEGGAFSGNGKVKAETMKVIPAGNHYRVISIVNFEEGERTVMELSVDGSLVLDFITFMKALL